MHRARPEKTSSSRGRRRACDPAPPHSEDSPLTRIQRAVVDLVCERGYQQVTTEQVLARAEVDRRDFGRYFAGLQDCCIETFECIARRCEARLYAAYDGPGSWRSRLRRAAYAAADFIRDHPREVRFALLELRRGSDLAKAQIEAAVELYTDLIDEGRQELEEPSSVSTTTAQGAVGSILSQVSARAQEYEHAEVEGFVPPLMYMAVRPYIGQQAALEELTMPRPGPAEGHR